MKKWTIRILVIVFAFFLLLLLVGCSSVDANEEVTIGARYELFNVSEADNVHIYAREGEKTFENSLGPLSNEMVTVELPWEICHDGTLTVTVFYADFPAKVYTFTADDFLPKGRAEETVVYRLRPIKG